MKKHVHKPENDTAYYVVYYATVAVMALAALWPDGRIWGVNWYGYFPRPVLLAVIAITGMLPLFLSWWSRRRGDLNQPAPGTKSVFFVGAGAVVLIGWLCFYFFKNETHLLGDGYLLISALRGVTELQAPSQFGSRQLQHLLYPLVSGYGDEAPRMVFRMISWGSGLVFLPAVFWAAYRLFESNLRRFLFAFGLITGGYALLFFGYVENYPPFAVGVTLFGLVGLMVAREQVERWWLLVPLLIAGFFHVFSAALLPAAAYLLLRETPLGDWFTKRRVLLWSTVGGIVAVAFGVAVYLFETNYPFRFALVSPVQSIFTVGGYTLFSAAHLSDWVNLLFILVPALLFLPVVLRQRKERGWFSRPDYLFLWLTLVPSLVLTFLIDPKLGMPRDWDLFSFVGIPLAMLLYYSLLDETSRTVRWKAATLAVALALMSLVPRVISQHDVEMSIHVFDRITALDPLRTRSVQEVVYRLFESGGNYSEPARRRAEYARERPDIAWLDHALQLGYQGRMDEAATELRRVIAFNPSHSAAWSNLGTYYQRRGQNDSALFCLKVADGLTPLNPRILDNMGIVYYSMADLKDAEHCWEEVISIDSLNYSARENLLKLYQTQGRKQEYLALSFEMFEIGTRKNAPLPYVRDLADLYLQKGDYAEAAVAYRRALARGLDTATVLELERQYPELHVLVNGR